MEGRTLPIKTSEVLEVAVKIPPAELAHRSEALEVELQLQLLLEVHVVSGAIVLGSAVSRHHDPVSICSTALNPDPSGASVTFHCGGELRVLSVRHGRE